jgi:hypothetical protein
MTIELKDEIWNRKFPEALRLAGFSGNLNLLAMHLTEIEGEAENWLDLFTIIRSHTYRGDNSAVVETLAEVTISMEHLRDHIQQALPKLQKGLDIPEQ